eukprot:c21463_g1_i1 orf=14-199(-)
MDDALDPYKQSKGSFLFLSLIFFLPVLWKTLHLLKEVHLKSRAVKDSTRTRIFGGVDYPSG